MEIQAIGSVGYQTQALSAASGTASAQSASSSLSGTTNSSRVSATYDVMDANQDGVVTLQERMAYILKLIAEEVAARAGSQRYNLFGETQSALQTGLRPSVSLLD